MAFKEDMQTSKYTIRNYSRDFPTLKCVYTVHLLRLQYCISPSVFCVRSHHYEPEVVSVGVAVVRALDL